MNILKRPQIAQKPQKLRFPSPNSEDLGVLSETEGLKSPEAIDNNPSRPRTVPLFFGTPNSSSHSRPSKNLLSPGGLLLFLAEDHLQGPECEFKASACRAWVRV